MLPYLGKGVQVFISNVIFAFRILRNGRGILSKVKIIA